MGQPHEVVDGDGFLVVGFAIAHVTLWTMVFSDVQSGALSGRILMLATIQIGLRGGVSGQTRFAGNANQTNNHTFQEASSRSSNHGKLMGSVVDERICLNMSPSISIAIFDRNDSGQNDSAKIYIAHQDVFHSFFGYDNRV